MRRFVVVVVLVVLAGCGGFATPEPTERVTPAPVPTADSEYPPGVTERGVTPKLLASTHARTLATTNYTRRNRQRVREVGGDLRRTTTLVHRVERGGDTYRGRFRQNATGYPTSRAWTRVDYWTANRSVAVRYNEAGAAPLTVRWETDGSGPVSDHAGALRLEATLAAVDVTVAGRTADGGVVLTGDSFRNANWLVTPQFVSEPRNVTFQAVVSPDGVVVSRRVAYDARIRDKQVNIVRETHLTRGTATVEEPEWATDAGDPRFDRQRTKWLVWRLV